MGNHRRNIERIYSRLEYANLSETEISSRKGDVYSILKEDKEMTNMPKILCPIDFSTNSIHAFHYAQRLAQKMKASIEVLYVYHIPLEESYVDAPRKYGDLDFSLRQDLEAKLRIFVEQHSECKVPVSYNIRVGGPAHEILEEADNDDVVLIAMGFLGLRGLQRILVGSTVEQVIRKATHPVLTIRPAAN